MSSHLPGARRGAAAVVAMVYLVLIATIAIATFWASSANTRIAYNIRAMEHASSNAESGIRWITDRFARMDRPKILDGKVTPQVANRIWGSPSENNTLVRSLAQEMLKRGRSEERSYSFQDSAFTTAEIWLDPSGMDRFQVTIAPREDDPRVLEVTSTGYHGRQTSTMMASRSVRMDYLIVKILPYAAMGNNQVQIGANTLIEGDLAMRTVLSDKRSPVLCVSDFNHMTSMKDKVASFRSLLKAFGTPDVGNRVSVKHDKLWKECIKAGFSDVDMDHFIDEYDIFLETYDRAVLDTDVAGRTVTREQEFDDDLEWFKAVNLLGKSPDPDHPDRNGYGPTDKNVDSLDRYAKIRGRLLLGESVESLERRLKSAGVSLADVVQGPISPQNPGDAPVLYDQEDQIINLKPSDFEEAVNRLRDMVVDDLNDSGAPNSKVISNRTITAAMATLGDPRDVDEHEVVRVTNANGLNNRTVSEGNSLTVTITNGAYVKKSVIDQLNQSLAENKRATYAAPSATTIIERFPYGATSLQATFKRPVFRGMTFRKCRIPKGLNALFIECKFEDVTFVDTDVNVGGATNESAGRDWAQSGGSFDKGKPLVGAGLSPSAGEVQTNGSKLGNNLRFESCTFEGPLVGVAAKAYTHHANSWEFNGVSPGTMFDNKWQDPNTGEPSATIIAPQVNIEMGSFSDQSATSELKGIVVGGNVDIRGKCIVDGCLISLRTKDGTMTLGYFGPGDDDDDPEAMPEMGGFGSIILRQNPLRTLPYGINMPVTILPAVETYRNVN